MKIYLAVSGGTAEKESVIDGGREGSSTQAEIDAVRKKQTDFFMWR